MAASVEHGHAHPEPSATNFRLPRLAWGVIAAVAVTVATAWAVTWATASDYSDLLMSQLTGAAPTSTMLFLALSGVMMVAMMLPSAFPMIRVYRSLADRDPEGGPAAARTGLFIAGYFVVWTLFAAIALLVLMALGLMGRLGGGMRLVPGLLLVGAGAYQFTAWKRFCLRHCRTPTGFVLTHWRSGRAGAARMGLSHGGYCLGCCWLLMLVLFVAGAMSVLWMGFFAGLVLVEKTWGQGEAYARAMGVLGILVGTGVAGWTGADLAGLVHSGA